VARTERKIWELVNRERKRRKRINEEIRMEEWKEYFMRLVGSVEKKVGRVPLAHIPIAHIHSHRPVLRVFPLDHQSENFILN